MRKLLLALIFVTVSLGAAAQGPGGGPGPVPSPWVAQGSTVSPAQSTMGITIPSTVTGGNRGAGTLNATQLFQNGVQVNTSALPTGQVWIGNGDGTAAPQTLTGDVTLTTGGLVTITDLAGVTNGSLANSGLTNSSTTVNGQTCTLGSTCTITAAATGVSIGVTTIASGTSNGLLYNNAGVLGNLFTSASGVLVTSVGSIPSISTTLPDALAMGTPASLTLTNATGLPVAGGGTGVTGFGLVTAKTSNDTLTAAQSYQTFTNDGAVGSVTLTLPTAAAGLEFVFAVTSSQTLEISAAGSSVIYVGELPSTAGGSAVSASPGSALILKAVSSSIWIAISITGQWSAL